MELASATREFTVPIASAGSRILEQGWLTPHNRLVRFMRFLAVVVLALWSGGLAALGGVAGTSIFETMEARDPVGGRDTAAIVFGDLFERFQYVAWGFGVLLLVSLGVRAALGPRPRRFAWRTWAAAGMLAASVASTLVIAPRIERARAEAGVPIASLPENDPRRTAFGRLHAASSGLMLLTIATGLGLLWMEVRDPH